MDTNTGTGPGLRAGRREWVGLAVLTLPAMLIIMDMTVLNLAVPALSADLAPSSSQLLWIVDIYGFLIAGFLITMGTLGDRIGRRRLLLTGGAAFGIASALAAFSTSAGMLIAARALLGVAGATLMPSTLSLIRNMFHNPRQRTFAITVWLTSFMVGAAIGPLVGGVLLEYFWWGSVFLLAVPVMALLVVVGPVLLPEYRDPEAGRLDLFSAALSLVAVLAVIYGLKQIAAYGLEWPPALSIVVGLAIGAVFVRRQRKLADPLLDLRLFADRAFSTSLGTLTLTCIFLIGIEFVIAQYLQLVLGLSPLEAGLWMLPMVGGGIVSALLSSAIVSRVRPAFVMGAGMMLAAVGFGVLTQVDAASGLAVVVTGSVLMFVGIMPVSALGVDIIVGAAPPERAGAASAISETGTEFGGALGIAIIGSIGTAAYRGQMTGAVPDGVPPEAAGAARDTLGGAVAVAGQLPDPPGAELIDTAREAFTQGLELNATIAAPILLGMAILAVVLLRHVSAGSEPEGQPDPKQEEAPADNVGIE